MITGLSLNGVPPEGVEQRSLPRFEVAALFKALAWACLGAVSLCVSYDYPASRGLIMVYLVALCQLAKQDKWRLSFYPALAVGVTIGAVELGFFWRIFSFGAVALWLVFAFWLALWAAISRLAWRWSVRWGWLLFPVIWTGLEFFRSELYQLKFTWVTPGFAFAGAMPGVVFSSLGVYGLGFLLMFLAAGISRLIERAPRAALVCTLLAGGLLGLGRSGPPPQAAHGNAAAHVRVAGIQMEFPSEAEVLSRLRMLARAAPDAELIVLSEYTFDGPIPQKVKDWCRLNSKYLIAGGKEPLGDKRFYNMAYVIGPQGTEVFRQAKHVPIQFFNDGLPAPRGEVWHSPWGKIGICICYDLGYTRVVDALVKLGAEALIVPTMDVVDWGVAQHVLHARIAPVRAAEHAIPVFRLASSGISQLVSRNGSLVAQAPFPGEGAVLQGTLDMGSPGSLPLDRWMVWPCVACCLLAPVWHWRRFLKTHPHNQSVTG